MLGYSIRFNLNPRYHLPYGALLNQKRTRLPLLVLLRFVTIIYYTHRLLYGDDTRPKQRAGFARENRTSDRRTSFHKCCYCAGVDVRPRGAGINVFRHHHRDAILNMIGLTWPVDTIVKNQSKLHVHSEANESVRLSVMRLQERSSRHFQINTNYQLGDIVKALTPILDGENCYLIGFTRV